MRTDATPALPTLPVCQHGQHPSGSRSVGDPLRAAPHGPGAPPIPSLYILSRWDVPERERWRGHVLGGQPCRLSSRGEMCRGVALSRLRATLSNVEGSSNRLPVRGIPGQWSAAPGAAPLGKRRELGGVRHRKSGPVRMSRIVAVRARRIDDHHDLVPVGLVDTRKTSTGEKPAG